MSSLFDDWSDQAGTTEEELRVEMSERDDTQDEPDNSEAEFLARELEILETRPVNSKNPLLFKNAAPDVYEIISYYLQNRLAEVKAGLIR